MTNRVKELEAAESLKEMIEIVGKYYDISAPLPKISKKIVASQIPNIVDMLRLPKK